MRAPVSVCMIVRDEEATGLFVECLESVRPHVQELVIVDTGSKDDTALIAKRYADRFERFVECNDPETGEIADFAMARNRSFSLASQPWVMWMDSDDRLRGADRLAELIKSAQASASRGSGWCFLFPYEYAYNAAGQCTCLHYRERLLSKREAMRWVNPVHEVLIPVDGHEIVLVPCDDVVFEHQRHRSKKAPSPGRNLRILKKLVEVDGCTDPRQFYYLGLEYVSSGDLAAAEKWLSRYVGVSGWDDEKTMAALKLAEIAYARNDLHEGIRWGFKAIETCEKWGEGYFALARGFYGLAMRGEGDVRRNWERCAHFAKAGLAMPPTRTTLFVNPLERAYDIHVYLNMALSQLGDIRGGLESAEAALRAVPSDPNLQHNRKVFMRWLAREDIRTAIGRLIDAGACTVQIRDQIESLLNTAA